MCLHSKSPIRLRPLELPTKYVSRFSSSSRVGDCCTLKTSSFSCDSSRISDGEGDVDVRFGVGCPCEECECILESMSIFSSFSSSKSFNSRTSHSNARTRSSSDSVYPRGNARRLSLSLVLHSNPTFTHCVQLGRMPSHRIFFERHRSQACAMRDWALDPTLITFIGRIPGMMAVLSSVPIGYVSVRSFCSQFPKASNVKWCAQPKSPSGSDGRRGSQEMSSVINR